MGVAAGWRPGPPPARAPRAVLYGLGAVGLLVGAAAGHVTLPQVGLAVGAVLALVALLGGREHAPWGAALVVALAGAGALLSPHAPVARDLTPDAAAAVGGGTALLLVGALELRGLRVGLLSTAAAVLAVAAVLRLREDVAALGRPSTWAALLFLLAAVNLLLWARDREAGLTGARV